MSFFVDCPRCGGGECKRFYTHREEYGKEYDAAVGSLLHVCAMDDRESLDAEARKVRELRFLLGIRP